MKLWKIAFAAAVLVFPISLTALAESTTVLTGQTGYPGGMPFNPYGSFNPYMGGYGIPPQAGSDQNQHVNNTPHLQQAGSSEQQAKSYHYKAPSGSGAGIPQEELPQRIFHNIPQPIYGEYCTCKL